VIAQVLGGIGVFLVGMILLTEGLKAAAGGALRRGLERVARGPVSSVLSGTAVTALVQSSSATTLTTIGFVSAGLLTFPQAVGLIFGANLGTTSTGWIVSVLGLKVSIGAVALPVVGVGALLRLLGRGRRADAGLALAGFGLIFLGIDTLQLGMEGLAERIDPARFPGATLPGRVLLVLIGAGMTVVMQSSSAAVATVLTALHAGTLGLEQTAYLVIGQNVGTTVKAILASLGASVPARRTALAHILFNLGAGALALAALPILLPLSAQVAGPEDPAMAIALFHTAFNVLGVLVFLPFLAPFCGLVERLIPERHPLLTRHLDRSVAQVPEVAVEAARRAAWGTAQALFQVAAKDAPGPSRQLEEVERALHRIRGFLGEVHAPSEGGEDYDRHLSVVHAVEHLDQLARILREYPGVLRGPDAGPDREWASDRHSVRALLSEPASDGEEGEPAGPSAGSARRFRVQAQEMARVRRECRDLTLRRAASGALDPDRAWEALDRLRKVDAVAYHAWRAVHHLELADPRGEPEPDGAASDASPDGEKAAGEVSTA
jgi:phosphate:Na+ symporter